MRINIFFIALILATSKTSFARCKINIEASFNRTPFIFKGKVVDIKDLGSNEGHFVIEIEKVFKGKHDAPFLVGSFKKTPRIKPGNRGVTLGEERIFGVSSITGKYFANFNLSSCYPLFTEQQIIELSTNSKKSSESFKSNK